MPTKKKKVYSIAEAARELKITRAAVHAAIKQKRLRAKHGTFEVERVVRTKVKGWVIDDADLRAYQVSEQHQDAGKKNE
jgi:predicted DNA-binding protein YlxM (UPF0122 family)